MHNSDLAVWDLHEQIKAFTYMLYCERGKMAIDFCADRLSDLENWMSAGVKHVLAIECDPDAVVIGSEARRRLEEERKKAPVVDPLEGDACTPNLVKDSGRYEPFCSPAAFCHFAVQYFLEEGDTTSYLNEGFLSNMVPYLEAGGKAVFTFMDGEKVRKAAPLQILSAGKNVLSAKIHEADPHKAHIMIGEEEHVEKLVDVSRLIANMERHGMMLSALVDFPTLAATIALEEYAALSQDGHLINSLYVCAVFEKIPLDADAGKSGSLKSDVTEFNAVDLLGLSQGWTNDVVTYLPLSSIMQLSAVSKTLFNIVESLPPLENPAAYVEEAREGFRFVAPGGELSRTHPSGIASLLLGDSCVRRFRGKSKKSRESQCEDTEGGTVKPFLLRSAVFFRVLRLKNLLAKYDMLELHRKIQEASPPRPPPPPDEWDYGDVYQYDSDD